tara:strand:- start:426 stop:545 length:120 start_codon:yes stop_codon:yes gene_type:complete
MSRKKLDKGKRKLGELEKKLKESEVYDTAILLAKSVSWK